VAGRVVSSLARRVGKRVPNRRFTLFCEGQNTEPAYFRALAAQFQGTIVEIAIVPAAGVPMTIAKKAADAKTPPRRKKDSYEENDEVWAVFDRDDHPNHDSAVRLCEDKGVGVARSNPCFEVWLLLHFRDYDRPDGRRPVQDLLEDHLPGYDARAGKTPDCHRLLTQLAEAEQRAERQLAARRGEGKPFGPPSTTVFDLTRAIAHAAAQSRRV
jgi:hypothetical protein